jgi:hypothetical protein
MLREFNKVLEGRISGFKSKKNNEKNWENVQINF